MRKITRIILHLTPISFLQRKSKEWILPGSGGFTVYNVVKVFRKQLNWQGLLERAAAISYNTIMALPPSLLFLFTLVPVLPFIPKLSLKLQLHELVYDIIPAKVHNKDIISFIDTLLDNAKVGLISFGFLLTLFFASNAVMGLMRSFNRDYVGFQKRKGLIVRWIAIKLTALIFGLLITYVFLLIMQGKILNTLVSDAAWRNFIYYSRWVLIVALVFFSISFLFKYGPSVQKRHKLVSPGGILSTFLCLISTLGFALFVNNFGRYNALYGTLGTVMVIMALIFINSLALLIGFELNVSILYLQSHLPEEKKSNDTDTVVSEL